MGRGRDGKNVATDPTKLILKSLNCISIIRIIFKTFCAYKIFLVGNINANQLILSLVCAREAVPEQRINKSGHWLDPENKT